MTTKPRLLFLYTGGTLSMVATEDPGYLAPMATPPKLAEHVPTLARVADVEGRVVSNVDSSDLRPSDWARLAQSIAEPTMTTTASWLSMEPTR